MGTWRAAVHLLCVPAWSLYRMVFSRLFKPRSSRPLQPGATRVKWGVPGTAEDPARLGAITTVEAGKCGLGMQSVSTAVLVPLAVPGPL